MVEDLRRPRQADRKTGPANHPEAAIPMSDDVSLDDLRRRINGIDDELLALVAERKRAERRRRPREALHRQSHPRLGARARSHPGGPRQGGGAGRGAGHRRRAHAPADPLLADHPGAAERRGQRHGFRPPGAGHRWRRQDGRLVRGVPEHPGLFRRGGGPDRCTGRRPARGRLAADGPETRLHHLRHAAQHDRRDPARPGPAPPVGRGAGCRLPQEPVALGPAGPEVARREGHVDPPDVRAGYAAPLWPPRDLRGHG